MASSHVMYGHHAAHQKLRAIKNSMRAVPAAATPKALTATYD